VSLVIEVINQSNTIEIFFKSNTYQEKMKLSLEVFVSQH
jgi:hypothetical protein